MDSLTFSHIYVQQIIFQQMLMQKLNRQSGEAADLGIPRDDVKWSSYHMQALMEEVGEILKADKRWKTHRNDAYDPANKLEEIADAMITLMNVAIYSGYSSNDVEEAIFSKIKQNTERLENAKR